jgi:hypothetical protein
MIKNDENRKVHESGIEYYEIALKSQDKDVDDIMLRLFESHSNARLEFETRDEYKIRRQYMNEYDKQKKRGYVGWPSMRYGSLTREKAMEVMEIIQKQNEENTKED